MMLIIPTLITIVAAAIAFSRYGDQDVVLMWALVPMWLCYGMVAVCDTFHIL